MKVSVIISTYNNPAWLEKVIWGYYYQTYRNFELVIADDGSDESTRQLIEQMTDETGMAIFHVWHPDNGFQKSAILNKATLASSSDYLIYSDGDCIPRNDFVEAHIKNAYTGYFLSGGYFKLPMQTSKDISKWDIETGNAFDVQWLRKHGLKKTFKTIKLTSRGIQERFLNLVTPTRATWNGHNSSGWKKDILAVNGYNEEMQYGGQDRELGERLVNFGIRGKQIRYSAICIHLDHARGYKTRESIMKNKSIRKETRNSGRTWTGSGIIKGGIPKKVAKRKQWLWKPELSWG